MTYFSKEEVMATADLDTIFTDTSRAVLLVVIYDFLSFFFEIRIYPLRAEG